MIKSPCSKAFLIYFIGGVLLACPILGHTDTDGPGNGEVNVYKGIFADTDIAQWTVPLDPKAQPIYNSEISPILTSVQRDPNLSSFYQALQLALNKTWRFDPSYDFSKCESEDPNYAQTSGNEARKIACQTVGKNGKKGEVIIDPGFFEALGCPKSCRKPNPNHPTDVAQLRENQRAVFLHELLLGITLGTPLSGDSINQVFTALSVKPLNVKKLEFALETSGFEPYVEQALKKQAGQTPCNPPPVQPPLTDLAQANIKQTQGVTAQITAPSVGVTDATPLEEVKDDASVVFVQGAKMTNEIYFQDGKAFEGAMPHAGTYCVILQAQVLAGITLSFSSNCSPIHGNGHIDVEKGFGCSNPIVWECLKLGASGKITVGDLKTAFGNYVVVDPN